MSAHRVLRLRCSHSLGSDTSDLESFTCCLLTVWVLPFCVLLFRLCLLLYVFYLQVTEQQGHQPTHIVDVPYGCGGSTARY